jgi:hypothetical protein
MDFLIADVGNVIFGGERRCLASNGGTLELDCSLDKDKPVKQRSMRARMFAGRGFCGLDNNTKHAIA